MIHYKNILLGVIFLFLFFPLLQNTVHLFTEEPLKGAVEKSPDAEFSTSDWLDGSYQPVKEKYINENFGFRNFLVRLNNQIDFSLFKKPHARDVVIGKKNYLYEINYIKAETGEDFLGKDSVQHKAAAIKLLQDSLKKKNIDLIIVFAPSKAAFFPEYIPEDLLRGKKEETNYRCYVEEFKKRDVNFLDFNSYFLATKNTALYPLYPQYGIHWSEYGSILVLDSILNYIQSKRKESIPELIIHNIALTDSVSDKDYDVADGLNLLFRLKTFKMAYTDVGYDLKNKDRLKLLTVADSYNWYFYGKGHLSQLFFYPHFWYYHNEMISEEPGYPKTTSEVNLREELERNNIIIIMATEANLPNLGWGFIEDAVSLYAKRGTGMN